MARPYHRLFHARRQALWLALTATLALPAWSQSFPSQPIRIINPSAPGAASDISARRLAEGMSKILNVPINVESKPGAGGAKDPALTGGGSGSAGNTGVDLTALLSAARGALAGGGNGPGGE